MKSLKIKILRSLDQLKTMLMEIRMIEIEKDW
jgi:hypothetical protein